MGSVLRNGKGGYRDRPGLIVAAPRKLGLTQRGRIDAAGGTTEPLMGRRFMLPRRAVADAGADQDGAATPRSGCTVERVFVGGPTPSTWAPVQDRHDMSSSWWS